MKHVEDEGWDMCDGKPVYNFCIVWWPDYPENMPEGEKASLWIAIGEYGMCLTPPVIPQPDDDDMKEWSKLARKARKKWQKDNPY